MPKKFKLFYKNILYDIFCAVFNPEKSNRSVKNDTFHTTVIFLEEC